MRVAFFADDGSASQAALLTAHGLASVDRTVSVVQVQSPGGSIVGLSCPHPRTIIRIPAVDCSGPVLAALLDKAERTDGDVIVAAPLRLVSASAFRQRNYLPVLPHGSTFLGTAALVRMLTLQEASALSAGEMKPCWLLACGPRAVADALSQAAAAKPSQEPTDRIRRLPVGMPQLLPSQAMALASGRPQRSVVRHGILLAAALEAAATNPYTDRLDRTVLTEMFSTGPDDDPQLSDRLRVLAGMFERLADDAEVPRSARVDKRPLVHPRQARDQRAGSSLCQSGHAGSHTLRVQHVKDCSPALPPPVKSHPRASRRR